MLEEGVKPARKVRRDKGKRLMTERDGWVLRWIAEQQSIRFDQLQELLSRYPAQHRNQAKAPGPDGLTDSAVLQIVTRWMQEPAYVEYERRYMGQPGWIWLTPYGERALEVAPDSQSGDIQESARARRYSVNQVRLACELQYSGGCWVSERSLPRTGERTLPDGEFWIAGQPMAVKVVPNLKRPGKQEEIRTTLVELLSNYETVWCFAVQPTQEIQAVQHTLSPQEQDRVRIVALEDRSGVPILRP